MPKFLVSLKREQHIDQEIVADDKEHAIEIAEKLIEEDKIDDFWTDTLDWEIEWIRKGQD